MNLGENLSTVGILESLRCIQRQKWYNNHMKLKVESTIGVRGHKNSKHN